MTMKKTDDLFIRAFGLFLLENSLNLFLKQCFNNYYISNYLSIFLGIIFLFYIIIMIITKYTFLMGRIIILETIGTLIIFYSVLNNLDFAYSILLKCSWIIIFCIPLSLFAYYVKDWNKVLNNIFMIVVICSFISVANVFLSKIDDYYNMSIGYSMLPLILIEIRKAISKKIVWFLVVLQIVLIVFYCSRGPLLCIAIYIIYLFFFSSNSKTKIFKKILFSFIFVFALINYSFILRGVNNILNYFGIYSRTMDMLSRGDINNSTGRLEVYQLLIPHIMDNPIFGLGVAGEIRYIISSPHLLFLELLLNYGLIVGLLISCFILIIISYSLIKTRFRNDIIILFMCAGFIHLMLSSTYLETPIFWILLATCLKIVRMKRVVVYNYGEERKNSMFVS